MENCKRIIKFILSLLLISYSGQIYAQVPFLYGYLANDLIQKEPQDNTQIFPIGVYWVKDSIRNEKIDYHYQVANCDINMIIGGAVGISEVELNQMAKDNGLKIILDTDANKWGPERHIVKKYASSRRMTYESTGYETQFNTQSLINRYENFCSDKPANNECKKYSWVFDYQNDTGEQSFEDNRTSIRAKPGEHLPGDIFKFTSMHFVNGDTDWFTFNLKIDNNSSTEPVANLKIFDSTNEYEKLIYANEFSQPNSYEEFIVSFTNGSREITCIITWLGNVQLWVDNVIIENSLGHKLFSGSVDDYIKNAIISSQ